jgi:hypothetical protein
MKSTLRMGLLALVCGCSGNLGGACADWVDEVNAQPCMRGDFALDAAEYCDEALLESYKASDCKESALEYFSCFIPVCEDDLPDWPSDCPALCNVAPG